MFSCFPKKYHLGPKNGSRSSRLKKIPKIINYATIKEIEKLKEKWWESKWNRRVATDIHLDRKKSSAFLDARPSCYFHDGSRCLDLQLSLKADHFPYYCYLVLAFYLGNIKYGLASGDRNPLSSALICGTYGI